jgi:hypothetical protein
VIIRQDPAWNDQRGSPRDPQAGNIPGGPRDVNTTSGTHVMNSPATTVNTGPFALMQPGPTIGPAPATTISAGMTQPATIAPQPAGSIRARPQERRTRASAMPT